GVAGRRLDDRPAGGQYAVALSRLDHPERDPVLHAPARIEELELREDLTIKVAADPVETHERRVADEIDERVEDLHHGARVRRFEHADAGALELRALGRL